VGFDCACDGDRSNVTVGTNAPPAAAVRRMMTFPSRNAIAAGQPHLEIVLNGRPYRIFPV
jgi:hypothetical protein